MNPYLYKAEIVSIWDGDTVTLNLDHGRNIWARNVKCRLYGINTPELRGDEREEGLKSKDALIKKLTNEKGWYRNIIAETHKDKTGKYGRDLITIWLDGENINQWLIDNGYAEVYK